LRRTNEVSILASQQGEARPGPRPRPRPGTRRPRKRAPLILLAPYIALYAVFFILPFIYSVNESTRSELTGQFIGAGNYVTVFHSGDFWGSMARMGYFTVVQVAIMLALALLLALLLDSRYCRGRRTFTLILFLPYAVPGVIAAIMWAFMLSPSTDPLVTTLHVQPFSSGVVLYVIMAIVTWEWTGYNMTLYLAGLTAVPAELIDAARVDGCGEIGLAWHVKIPLLRRILLFTITASLIGTFQLFNEPAIISYIHPLGVGYTPNLLIYTTAFSFGDVPLAAAESVVLAAITISAAAMITLARQRRAGVRRRSAGMAG
jgi:multiple sugar transport system permease protein